MTALEVFEQQDGEVTKGYYAEMNLRGWQGQLAVALFRAQKRSTAAKKYRGRRFKRDAYDVKNWSLSEICRVMVMADSPFAWGWQRDENTPGFEWVLYVELPTGQCSFHSADRLQGPDYRGNWDGLHASKEHIMAFCDHVAATAVDFINGVGTGEGVTVDGLVADFPTGALDRVAKTYGGIARTSEPKNPWDAMKLRLQNLEGR